MRRLVIALSVLAALGAIPSTATAQTVQPFALDRYGPTPAGDRFFAVPGADPAGHGTFRAALVLDYAHRPLVVYQNDGEDDIGSIVSDQLFLHAGASVGLFDRLQLSLNAPFALVTSGDSPTAGGVQLASPSGAALGDLRLGARVRFAGEARGPVQFALGGLLYLPTGDEDSYASDGSVRGRPELILSGEGKTFAYAVETGILLRPTRSITETEVTNEVSFGAGVAALLADRKVQIGPELYGSTTLENGFERGTTNLEAILGARVRLSAFVLGAGVGPGITRGLGTPSLRGLLSLAYSPEIEEKPPERGDRDRDGVYDDEDACMETSGIRTDDPDTNGCPDRDEDGVFDKNDACIDVKGVATDDPETNGCPSDKDGDGIIDEVDACPELKGETNDDPKKNGCPPDRDGDGVYDEVDACPDVAGVASTEPGKNGCPPDTDGDTITDDKDACPRERGKADPDPQKNGCPTKVRVTEKEILILEKVEFKTGSDVILPGSDELLEQVAEVLREHPEIKKIEVQGHTDSRGGQAFNKKLSERRAASVAKWLVTRGKIEESRLISQGFGMDVPIADNATDAGRQANRRVEFKIVEVEKKTDEQKDPQ
jgi:outer membrane protein OmpA-like peptidoglycan-associated protein